MASLSRPPIKRQYGRPSTSTSSPAPPTKRARLTYGSTSKSSTSKTSSPQSAGLSSSPRKRNWTSTVSKAWDEVLKDQEEEDEAEARLEEARSNERKRRRSTSPLTELESEDGRDDGDGKDEVDTPATTPDLGSPEKSASKAAVSSSAGDAGPSLTATLSPSKDPDLDSPGGSRRLRPRSSPLAPTVTASPSPPKPKKTLPATTSKGKGKASSGVSDLRNFFSLVTSAPSSSSATSSRARSNTPSVASTSQAPAKQPLSQLMLDLSNRPSTKTCSACGMSYVLGVPEDLALHQTHHSRVVNGIEWPLASTSEGVEVVGLGVGKQDKIVVVDLSLLSDATVAPAKGKKLRPQISRKVAEVLEMVDTSLGATPLSPSQRAEAKAFLYIGPSAASNSKSKSSGTGGAGTKTVVKGVCIAGRIEKAYKVLSSTDVGNDVTPSSSQVKVEDSQVSKEEGSDVRRQDDLLRFGEDDSAVFCSPDAYSALIGIHRIYTLPSSRLHSIASTLLNTVAERFIYGMPLKKGDRRVAFSQPSRSGRGLARRWTGTEAFGVFVD